MRQTAPTSTHIRSGIIYPNHDPSFSRALGSREGGIHLFETAYRSHVRPRSPPNLGSGGSEALIRGFEAVRESGILPNLDLQFGSLRDDAQSHVTPKCDEQLACHRDDGDTADLATPVANAFAEPSTESAAGLVP